MWALIYHWNLISQYSLVSNYRGLDLIESRIRVIMSPPKASTDERGMQEEKKLPKMPYVRLGQSGLKVSRLIMGCGSYGDKSQVAWCIEEDEALRHLNVSQRDPHTDFNSKSLNSKNSRNTNSISFLSVLGSWASTHSTPPMPIAMGPVREFWESF